jgi:hypothetical protein
MEFQRANSGYMKVNCIRWLFNHTRIEQLLPSFARLYQIHFRFCQNPASGLYCIQGEEGHSPGWKNEKQTSAASQSLATAPADGDFGRQHKW